MWQGKLGHSTTSVDWDRLVSMSTIHPTPLVSCPQCQEQLMHQQPTIVYTE